MKREEALMKVWSADLRGLVCAVVVAFTLILSRPAEAQQVRVTLDPATTKISISVHDVHGGVHGNFQMRSGTVSFEPSTGAAGGEIIIDPSTGKTGNDSRDRKMKKDVLETQRYPEITFTPTHILGQFAPQSASNLKIEGIFRIHGSDHNLTLDVPVQVNGDTVTGTTSFSVPYESWGMKNPSFLFLRVDGTAEVNVAFAGRLNSAPPLRSQSELKAPSH